MGMGGTATSGLAGRDTELVRAVADRAQADGWTCLAVQGVESEAVLSGAGLLAALTPLHQDLDSVPAVQADALAAALGWGPAGGSGRASGWMCWASRCSPMSRGTA